MDLVQATFESARGACSSHPSANLRPFKAFLMPSDESLRPDASTVHRPSGHSDGLAPTASVNNGVPAGAEDIEQMAQANTVIRGSSRIDKPARGIDSLDRTPVAVAKVLLGQRLNHFLLEELIGGGGMGAVFRARDEQLDRTVAIKVIPFVGDDPDLQRRFRNEAQSAAKLDHPRIARVFDVGSHGEWHYIVFEYIEGTNIRDFVNKNGVLSVDEAVFNTSQLAGALQHAADRGIVHRDIKPSNVLIGDQGKIKLVDMGLARSDNLDLSEDMTASGVTLGTFDYISPEQAHDPRQADLRSDIYSLGCTLYFMLTGVPPYPGGTMLQKLLSHGNAPPPNAKELRPEVSDNLVAVLQKMLAKDPVDRYQTATDLIADLREVASRDGLVRSQALGPVAVSLPNPLVYWFEKHAPWMVAVMLLLASTGWLHLESATLRNELRIPRNADRLPFGATASEASRQSREIPPLPESPIASEATPAETSAESGTTGPPAEAPQAASGPTGESFPPPDQPPQLSGVTVPSELLDGSAMLDRSRPPEDDSFASVDDPGFNEGSSGEEPFSMQGRFLGGDDDVSIEPFGSYVPHVVRLVGPDLEPGYDRDAEGAALAPTLARALEMAAQYGASRLEIAVPVVYSEPVTVAVDNLLIKSTVGGSMVVFEPKESHDMERSRMFTVGSNQIEFEDLHFVWNVPVGEIDGGTLFELNENHFVEFTDCSITVSNPSLRDEVYAFDVITDQGLLRRRSVDLSEVEAFPLVRLKLNNVSVRGQMTMLHMDYATRLMLSWENGLLAITQNMVDTAGARQQPTDESEKITLSLTRVTAHAPEGIVRMRVGVSGAFPLVIDRTAFNSVFVVNPETPHFEFAGLRSLEKLQPLLRLQGASNAYMVEPTLADPMLILSTFDGDIDSTRMSDLASLPPVWAQEDASAWSVQWSAPRLSTAPASQRIPADYRQDGESPPGFDEKYLPNVRVQESTRLPENSAAFDRSRLPDTADERVPTIRSALKNSVIREEL